MQGRGAVGVRERPSGCVRPLLSDGGLALLDGEGEVGLLGLGEAGERREQSSHPDYRPLVSAQPLLGSLCSSDRRPLHPQGPPSTGPGPEGTRPVTPELPRLPHVPLPLLRDWRRLRPEGGPASWRPAAVAVP